MTLAVLYSYCTLDWLNGSVMCQCDWFVMMADGPTPVIIFFLDLNWNFISA